jgi:hypothetical protein
VSFRGARRITAAQWTDVLAALTDLNDLEELDLSDTSFGDAALHAMKNLLASKKQRERFELRLAHCANLRGRGDLAGLASALLGGGAGAVTSLVLEGCPLEPLALMQLLRAAARNPALEKLSLSDIPAMRAQPKGTRKSNLLERKARKQRDSQWEDVDMQQEEEEKENSDPHPLSTEERRTGHKTLQAWQRVASKYKRAKCSCIPASAPRLTKQQSAVHRAVLEFGVSHGVNPQSSEFQSQVQLHLDGWSNADGSLFLALYQCFQNPRNRIQHVSLQHCEITQQQKQYVSFKLQQTSIGDV